MWDKRIALALAVVGGYILYRRSQKQLPAKKTRAQLTFAPSMTDTVSEVATVQAYPDGKRFLFQKKVGGFDREFLVSVPQSYTGDKPVPLLLGLHGAGGNGASYANKSGWPELGERKGFISVFPSALVTCMEGEDARGRPAGTKSKWIPPSKRDKVCAGHPVQDDLEFIRQILNEIQSRYNIDTNRIYASGFSNGFGMVLNGILGVFSDTFAAVGGVGSTLKDPLQLQGRGIPVLVMLGSDDPYFTGAAKGELPTTPQEFATNSFTQQTEKSVRASIGNDTSIPRAFFREGILWAQYRNARVPFTYGIMKGVDHTWPNGAPATKGIQAAPYIWKFFEDAYVANIHEFVST